jgi:hypothetical protein
MDCRKNGYIGNIPLGELSMEERLLFSFNKEAQGDQKANTTYMF